MYGFRAPRVDPAVPVGVTISYGPKGTAPAPQPALLPMTAVHALQGSGGYSEPHFTNGTVSQVFHLHAALPSSKIAHSKLRLGDLSAEMQPKLDAEDEEEAEGFAVGLLAEGSRKRHAARSPSEHTTAKKLRGPK